MLRHHLHWIGLILFVGCYHRTISVNEGDEGDAEATNPQASVQEDEPNLPSHRGNDVDDFQTTTLAPKEFRFLENSFPSSVPEWGDLDGPLDHATPYPPDDDANHAAFWCVPPATPLGFVSAYWTCWNLTKTFGVQAVNAVYRPTYPEGYTIVGRLFSHWPAESPCPFVVIAGRCSFDVDANGDPTQPTVVPKDWHVWLGHAWVLHDQWPFYKRITARSQVGFDTSGPPNAELALNAFDGSFSVVTVAHHECAEFYPLRKSEHSDVVFWANLIPEQQEFERIGIDFDVYLAGHESSLGGPQR